MVKYQLITIVEPIKSGEIRIEWESTEVLSICKYTRDLDPESAVVIDYMSIGEIMLMGWEEFLEHVDEVIAGLEYEKIRITKEVGEFFNCPLRVY